MGDSFDPRHGRCLSTHLKKLIYIMESAPTYHGKISIPISWNKNCLIVIIELIDMLLHVPTIYLPIDNDFRVSMYMSINQLNSETTSSNTNIFKVCTKLIELMKNIDELLLYEAEGFEDYWRSLAKWSFKSTWLPTLEDISRNSLLINSCFSIETTHKNSIQTVDKSPLLYTSLLGIGENYINHPLIRARKYRLKPTSNQKKILNTWADNSRFSYNKAVDLLLNTDHESKNELRDLITPEAMNTQSQWVLDTPKSIREAAVFEAYKNKEACLTNLEEGNIKSFQLKFQSRKKPSWTINGLDSVKIKSNKSFSMYTTYRLGDIKTCEKLPPKTMNDVRTSKKGNTYRSITDYKNECALNFDGLYYYLVIPRETQKDLTTSKPHFSVSCDPGVRTMETCYMPDSKTCLAIGHGTAERLFSIAKSIDRMIALKGSSNKKKRKLLNNKIKKKRVRIQNLQQEMHWKMARYLCSNFRQVVIPNFGSKKMIKRNCRNISTDTVRKMMLLGHGKFLERLKTKAEEMGTRIEIVSEFQTTMTCGKCDNLQRDIGSKEEWECGKCHTHHDRDGNASRNIYIKQWK